MDHYDGLTGPINLAEDTEAVRDFKAASGATAYAFRKAGWTEEQISNGLRTWFQAATAVLAEKLREADPSVGLPDEFQNAANYLLDPEE